MALFQRIQHEINGDGRVLGAGRERPPAPGAEKRPTPGVIPTRVDSGSGVSRSVRADTSRARHTFLSITPLPGSRGFLYTACLGNCALESAIHVFDFSVDSGRVLVPKAAGAWFSPTGHLLYADRARLHAAGFDADRLELTTLRSRVDRRPA